MIADFEKVGEHGKAQAEILAQVARQTGGAAQAVAGANPIHNLVSQLKQGLAEGKLASDLDNIKFFFGRIFGGEQQTEIHKTVTALQEHSDAIFEIADNAEKASVSTDEFIQKMDAVHRLFAGGGDYGAF